jgi:hypothetical protein
MSWTRIHLETMAKMQLTIQRLVEEAGADAVGVDALVQANEELAETQAYALVEVERAERKQDALRFAEALRPFAVPIREGR